MFTVILSNQTFHVMPRHFRIIAVTLSHFMKMTHVGRLHGGYPFQAGIALTKNKCLETPWGTGMLSIKWDIFFLFVYV